MGDDEYDLLYNKYRAHIRCRGVPVHGEEHMCYASRYTEVATNEKFFCGSKRSRLECKYLQSSSSSIDCSNEGVCLLNIPDLCKATRCSKPVNRQSKSWWHSKSPSSLPLNLKADNITLGVRLLASVLEGKVATGLMIIIIRSRSVSAWCSIVLYAFSGPQYAMSARLVSLL